MQAVIEVIGAIGQGSRGDLHGVADADGKLSVGDVHAVAELNGEGECAGSGGCAIDFAGCRVPGQTRRRCSGNDRPGDRTVATGDQQELVVIDVDFAGGEGRGDDGNAAARLDDEIVRGIVVVNDRRLVAGALIIAAAKNVVQAVIAAIAIDTDSPCTVGHVH